MRLDFTLDKYTDLCEAIVRSGYTPMTVRDYLETDSLPSRLAVMRHDVDETPRNELTMAQIENDFGIRSTYYFRFKRDVLKPALIREVAGMGHEIGYHYEVVDKAKGNLEKALEIFGNELTAFRDFADVKTISMHGNPLTRWDNRDLWREHDFKGFGILGEAYLSFDSHSIAYLSDTGRTWGPEFKTKDWLLPRADGKEPSYVMPRVHSTDDVITVIRQHHCDRLYFNIHPGRWGDGVLGWAGPFAKDEAVNLVKQVLALGDRIARKTS
jgi:hypothetical protein